ncbi:unnamed protein product [Chondrus crispus]|uniref:Secreted protein n=1 Tax=Chondrus crispus TaxID=2769 RepID=R7QSI0_CHOCR|nr:unnamed protein product [Chondrus crispus]CDF40461.1 unnamed protein product [Chondrus crispus]|eukprot:XP_005710755.1 unnamed protein product [Chondrus crispus]
MGSAAWFWHFWKAAVSHWLHAEGWNEDSTRTVKYNTVEAVSNVSAVAGKRSCRKQGCLEHFVVARCDFCVSKRFTRKVLLLGLARVRVCVNIRTRCRLTVYAGEVGGVFSGQNGPVAGGGRSIVPTIVVLPSI